MGKLRTSRARGQHLLQLGRISGPHIDELESTGGAIKPESEIAAPGPERVQSFSFLPTKAAWHEAPARTWARALSVVGFERRDTRLLLSVITFQSVPGAAL